MTSFVASILHVIASSRRLRGNLMNSNKFLRLLRQLLRNFFAMTRNYI
ncbi:hypothetical protein [Rickettsia felis]|nr:hypothetical protein [Rickettsia felis]